MIGVARLLALVALILPVSAAVEGAPSAVAASASIGGTVQAAGVALPDYTVTLYAAGTSSAQELGSTTTAADGSFTIGYEPPDPTAVLYLEAREAPPATGVRALWSVLGPGTPPSSVVVNEVTTVATAYAMAQFTDGVAIAGPSPGLPNAASMAHDVADVVTGERSSVLLTSPNGDETRARDTFDSLANAVVACVESDTSCDALFAAATSPTGSVPADTYAAIVDIAHSAWYHLDEVYAVTLLGSTPHQPALTAAPPGWTLALRFNGNGLGGPGNIVIDEQGNLWVNENYDYSTDINQVVCGSGVVSKFLPNGQPAPGSPYAGGGLNGAGWGIGRDPFGDIWVGNFGFASKDCANPPPHNSVSQFHSDGTAVSPDTGWTQGGISWPQATVSDDTGTIWIANCGNSSVTQFPGGDPNAARQLTGLGVTQPFSIAFGKDGTAFVTGSASDTVAMIGPDGTPRPGSPISGPFRTPMGVATDSTGHVWVTNQGAAAPNCPQFDNVSPGSPSVALLGPDGTPVAGTPFTGGGIRLPWGIAVDGNDNVWVADFGGQRVSEFCGVPTIDCHPGAGTGSPISPDTTGYGFDGLTRNTGVAIDPSGNVWLMNNWRQDPLVPNPGGHEIVAFLGMAGPVQPAAPRERPTPAAPVTPVATPVAVVPRFTG
jgi:NHL repeat